MHAIFNLLSLADYWLSGSTTYMWEGLQVFHLGYEKKIETSSFYIRIKNISYEQTKLIPPVCMIFLFFNFYLSAILICKCLCEQQVFSDFVLLENCCNFVRVLNKWLVPQNNAFLLDEAIANIFEWRDGFWNTQHHVSRLKKLKFWNTQQLHAFPNTTSKK